jgi:hypothetical protein
MQWMDLHSLEDGGRRFLQNVFTCLLNYITVSKESDLHIHSCEDLRSDSLPVYPKYVHKICLYVFCLAIFLVSA